MVSIVVLGAGVVGLTTAIELKKWNPNLEITIAAHHFPGDLDSSYTSPWAGANWQSFATGQDVELQKIDRSGYDKFMQLAANDPRAGVWIVDNTSYYTKYEVASAKGNLQGFIPWYRDSVKGFKVIEEDKIPFDDVSLGTTFKGVVITVPIYLSYLVQQNKELGNRFQKIPLIKHIKEARTLTNDPDYVINATGLGATKISGVEDRKENFSVKGQTLLVENSADSTISVQGFPGLPDEMLYVMPRRDGGSIIGGCFRPGDESVEEDKELTARLIRRAVKYVPSLINPKFKNNPTKIEIKRVNIGFRPFREDGIRIEVDPKYKWLIHDYGAGAGGYQGSVGMGRKVVEVLQKELSHLKSKI
ncbi:hypothetical protein CANMA_003746 [Candida margitis]|uniref:uncharacterized protein n=1 Tax=Candida margitis TaxID=1775924 RepID=UPI002225D658|nr:uncharacterized protein CANMA_003746 [Candida margitis]KAI5961769.1 hypothetical protein CANMA_003746 [Candida margitis]